MRYHFVGIGGIGMSGIAQLMLKRGIKVSGSDLKETAITRELQKAGAEIFVGHKASNIDGADLIVYSSAINENNPEIIAARKNNITIIKRAQALAELMRNQNVITVTGSHGKTTTTSLAAYLLLEAGLSPSVAVGGIVRNINNNAFSGSGGFFVAEADESDASFLCYSPRYSIITNIDHEHLDYYGNFDNALSAYKEFLNKTSPQGCVFCCSDDANLMALLKGYNHKYILFGLNSGADIYPKNIRMEGLTSEFDCFCGDKFVDRFSLRLAGNHNISNALAVVALGLELGIDLKFIKKALAHYQGAGRRIEVKLESAFCMVIDDYAHHPTEIKATLAAVNCLKRRVIAVFQPHRFTRTKLLLEEFGQAFKMADYVIVTDIYSANETPLEGASGRAVYEKIKAHAADKEVHFLPKNEIVGHVLGMLQKNDLVITLGAGDINKIGDELVEGIKNKS